MGGLFGGSKSSTKPMKEQMPFIKQGFNEAQSIYNSQKDTPWYTGDLYAGMDPLTAQGVSSTGAYTTGTGADAANKVSQFGSSMLDLSPELLKYMGLYGDTAAADPTQANISAASQYADNPYMQGQIDAALRDVNRNLTEDTLPSIDRAAVATGNTNSSRAGVAEGIALRGAQDRAADISSQMRGDAYDRGLGLAESARGTNLTAMGNAANLYGNALNMGLSSSQQGQQMTLQNLESLVNAGKISQADAQGFLDADFQKWQGNDTRASDLLNRYWGIVGDVKGSTTKTSSSPGILGGALGIASVAGGLGWKPFG